MSNYACFLRSCSVWPFSNLVVFESPGPVVLWSLGPLGSFVLWWLWRFKCEIRPCKKQHVTCSVYIFVGVRKGYENLTATDWVRTKELCFHFFVSSFMFFHCFISFSDHVKLSCSFFHSPIMWKFHSHLFIVFPSCAVNIN